MNPLSKDELIRYNRQILLPEIGIKGQEKLKNAKVLVIGAGGLGCPALQYLCAAGIGTIGIVDFDKVELHNLHRQILFSVQDVGKLKAETAVEKLKLHNPHVTFQVYNTLLNEENAHTLIAPFDVIVDGSDNFQTRYLVNDTCVALNKPLVYGTILKFEAQLAVFNYKNGIHLRDIYPEPPNTEDVPSCDQNGVLGVVPGILGVYMANAAIKIILGHEIGNHLFIYNFDTFEVKNLNLMYVNRH